MDNRYEAYAYADPLFYDSPRRWGAHEEFAAVTRPLPDGWERGELEMWSVVRPTGVRIPDQGWKIHVSSCIETAEEVLETVHAYCLRERITFKFLRGLPILQVQNSKYAPRGSSGKFCTLYPVDDAELERCLHGLGRLLAGRKGPYILSDLRWADGPLYLRYGGFAERYCRNEQGSGCSPSPGPTDGSSRTSGVPASPSRPGRPSRTASPRPWPSARRSRTPGCRTRWSASCTSPTPAASTWPATVRTGRPWC
ncbi:hypothetical protein ACFQ0M_35380 [Kitasatospora aburaviensis]